MSENNNDYGSFIDEFVDQEGIDQNEATKGGGTIAPPEAGRAFARLVEYVELGAHYGMYQGKPKAKPDHLVRITIELSGKKYPLIELEDGTKVPQKLFLELNLSSNDRSRFFKLFRAINGMHGDKYKHFASMVADNVGFIVTIAHRDNGKTGEEKRVYANIWKDGSWQVEAAIKRIYKDDDDTEGTPVPVSIVAAETLTKIFLFNRPRLVDWTKLFIDGVRDDGATKNWIQERILSAVNFSGSPLEALLAEIPVPESSLPATPAKGKKATAKQADPVDDI